MHQVTKSPNLSPRSPSERRARKTRSPALPGYRLSRDFWMALGVGLHVSLCLLLLDLLCDGWQFVWTFERTREEVVSATLIGIAASPLRWPLLVLVVGAIDFIIVRRIRRPAQSSRGDLRWVAVSLFVAALLTVLLVRWAHSLRSEWMYWSPRGGDAYLLPGWLWQECLLLFLCVWPPAWAALIVMKAPADMAFRRLSGAGEQRREGTAPQLAAVCNRCSYDLRGLNPGDACPECGGARGTSSAAAWANWQASSLLALRTLIIAFALSGLHGFLHLVRGDHNYSAYGLAVFGIPLLGLLRAVMLGLLLAGCLCMLRPTPVLPTLSAAGTARLQVRRWLTLAIGCELLIRLVHFMLDDGLWAIEFLPGTLRLLVLKMLPVAWQDVPDGVWYAVERGVRGMRLAALATFLILVLQPVARLLLHHPGAARRLRTVGVVLGVIAGMLLIESTARSAMLAFANRAVVLADPLTEMSRLFHLLSRWALLALDLWLVILLVALQQCISQDRGTTEPETPHSNPTAAECPTPNDGADRTADPGTPPVPPPFDAAPTNAAS